jgi:ParB-like chromosome segregation protein Spo0J
MSASNHINQEQLRALIALDFPSDNDDNYYTVGQLDPELSFDAHHYDELKADIAKNGIQRPIKTIHGAFLNEGHHRAVAARELGIEKIPVINFDDAEDRELYDSHEESTRWKLFK